eukprot:gene4041-biopygen14410
MKKFPRGNRQICHCFSGCLTVDSVSPAVQCRRRGGALVGRGRGLPRDAPVQGPGLAGGLLWSGPRRRASHGGSVSG